MRTMGIGTRRLAILLAGMAAFAGACGSSGGTKTAESSTSSTSASLANPASQFCEKQGGTVDMVEDANGGTRGVCVLADGSRVDEWEYYRQHGGEQGQTCSASGLSADVAAEAALPRAVATMRADIARAAVNCDYTSLGELVDRNGKAIRFTFGDGNDAVAYWKQQETSTAAVKPLRAMRLLLQLPHGETRAPDGTVTYVWPAAFASDHPTDAQLAEIAASGLYDMTTLRGWVSSGTNYLGYRILITGNGDWSAFVEGD